MGKDLKGKEIGTGITQTKKGSYLVQFVGVNGYRYRKTFKRISDARAWLEDSKYEDKHNKSTNISNITMDKWFEYWINDLNGQRLRYNTKKSYQGRYDNRIKPVMGKLQLKDVKPIHCQQVLNLADSKGDSSGSMVKIRSLMTMLFTSAIENQLITYNPVVKSVKSAKKVPKERRVLTQEEQKQFTEVGKDTAHYDEYMFILTTGLRIGELTSLKWSDIDWKNNAINIRTTAYKVDDEFEDNPTKTRASRRTVPLTNKAREILINKKKENDELKIVNVQYYDNVFINCNGNLTTNQVYNKCLKKIIKKIGIVDAFSVHNLRHTFATRCIEAGMKPKTLQKILGHENIATTMDLYVHVTNDELMEEIRLIEGVI